MDAADRQDCVHLDQIEEVTPNSDVCEACIALGDTWVNLRVCMICGQVGCCDDSKNTHARKHFKATGHPIIMSFQPGEDWLWCYVDEALFI
ncbi:MAG: hypothetical protein GTO18_22525 [Anaerolineales bacterium]|nr:hypothetical protein [Anaerolineales bacterium]